MSKFYLLLNYEGHLVKRTYWNNKVEAYKQVLIDKTSRKPPRLTKWRLYELIEEGKANEHQD